MIERNKKKVLERNTDTQKPQKKEEGKAAAQATTTKKPTSNHQKTSTSFAALIVIRNGEHDPSKQHRDEDGHQRTPHHDLPLRPRNHRTEHLGHLTKHASRGEMFREARTVVRRTPTVFGRTTWGRWELIEIEVDWRGAHVVVVGPFVAGGIGGG